MVTKENFKKIKKITEEFFKKTGLEIGVKISSEKDLTIPIELKTEDPQSLIGEGGETLAEIQHLLKAILKKQIPEEIFHIDLDVNDYKKKKADYLKELARSSADEVSLSKKEKTLPPMRAFERRIVHLELSAREDVETASSGEEPERCVVIKPRP